MITITTITPINTITEITNITTISAWLSILLYVFALLFPHYNDVCMTSVWDLKFRLR